MHLTGLKLRPADEEPLYRQLFDQIVSRIRSGAFPPGVRLPPTRDLASELSTHRNTVVHAYQELEAAGFVFGTVGRGTFVASLTDPSSLAKPRSRPSQTPLPWDALVSLAVINDAFVRTETLSRGVAAADAVQMNRMQPSPELLPIALLERCLHHVLRTYGADALGYSAREGLPRLRTLIAQDLERQSVPASADDLIVTTGSQQALDLIARTLVNRGDTVLVDASTYHGAVGLLSSLGARLVGIPCDDEGPELQALERVARSGAKAFYLMPNCQNPTGQRVSLARREALVAWSHDAGVPLIEDDYASDLILDGAPPLPPLRALDGDVIYVGTYGKKLAPALRIGYLLSPRMLFQRLAALKYSMDLGTSLLLQHGLAEFLERGYLPAHLAATLPQYRKRRDALNRALRKNLPASVQWRTPQSGLALWIPTPAGIDPEALFFEAQLQGALISSGTLNGVTAAGQQGVRLSYCAESPARLAEGARRLGRAWAALGRTTRKQIHAQRVEMV